MAEVRGGVVVEVWVVVMEVVMAVAAHHLRDDAQREPELRLREVADVDAVEGDAAALQVEGMVGRENNCAALRTNRAELRQNCARIAPELRAELRATHRASPGRESARGEYCGNSDMMRR